MNAAAQPILPQTGPEARNSDSDQVYMTSAGARPKLTRSDSESYCTPKSLWVPVRRATLPSMLSSSAATNTATAADVEMTADAGDDREEPGKHRTGGQQVR